LGKSAEGAGVRNKEVKIRIKTYSRNSALPKLLVARGVEL